MQGKRVLVAVFGLFFLLLSVSAAQEFQVAQAPPPSPALKVQLPLTIKDIHLFSPIALQALEKQQLDRGTKALINQQFAPLVGQSISVQPRVTILGKVGNRIQAESLVVFRAKNTYTATISKLTYEVEGDKVNLKSKIDHYSPTVQVIHTPAKVDPAVIKWKGDILANLKISYPHGWGPKALANTPCPEFPSAVKSTDDVYKIFQQAFALAEKKVGAESTKTAIMEILQKGTRLLAWNNIGHGNPSCVVQWNDEVIWDADFNTTTSFQGIYHAVLLLNSCQVCGPPYKLRDAIKKHQPRTYIGGIPNLPVARSEYVDVEFWDSTLLKGKTMADALNVAATHQGLVGSFCLDGYSGKFAEVEAAKITEDCIAFNPNIVEAKNVGGRWKVVHGSMWMLDFANKEAEARKAVEIIKHYKFDRQCFVGRPDAPMQYYTVGGKAPQGAFSGEDSIGFNPQNIVAQNIGGRWKVVEGSHWILDFANKEGEAKIAVQIIKHYGFNHICFVGRPQAPMMYFRR